MVITKSKSVSASKEIKQKNALFRSMTSAERRVAIAKDALSQLREERYIAARGNYVEATDFIDKEKLKQIAPNDFQDQQVCSLMSDLPRCDVCARGALFVSTLRVFNRLRVDELESLSDDLASLKTSLKRQPKESERIWDEYNPYISLDDPHLEKYERRFFSRRQSDLMEAMFEGYCADDMSVNDVAIEMYGDDYHDSQSRLMEICKNLIRNNGNFVIPEKFIKKATKIVKDRKEWGGY